MRRTQLYLEDDLWQALHTHAALAGSTISELVRIAARERYMGSAAARQDALMGAVGLWKNRKDLPDSEAYVRGLRKGTRLKRLEIL